MSTGKDWAALEDKVRQIASFKWGCPAKPEVVNGIRMDAVLRLEADRWVCIEITKENDLSKLRTDAAKFASVKPFLLSTGIYCEAYFITRDKPNPSLIETGKGISIRVMSSTEFEAMFLDFSRYRELRGSQPFGSAVDPVTGRKDHVDYVPVRYQSVETSKEFTVDGIAELLEKNHHVVLLGHFGTGKSRCVQEVFNKLALPSQSLLFPIALNLREHWGNKRATELVRRHFDDLGLSNDADSLLRVLDKNAVPILLDGFDELGAQIWSDDPLRLRDIRREALSGVRDLIKRSNRGVLITGREHYFSSDEEMIAALGLVSDRITLLRCPDEFTTQEMEQYLNAVAPGAVLPPWLPRRPLICQIIASLEPEEVRRLVGEQSGEYEFWGALLRAICEREKRINTALDETVIRRVLARIARITRTKVDNVGPISLTEISKAFESVTGRSPTEESVTMLNRLPALGRISSDSNDRQFIDIYILDGLRAEDLQQAVYEHDDSIQHEVWTNPLDRLGLSILAQEIQTAGARSRFQKYLRSLANHSNQQAAADLFGAFAAADDDIDCEGLRLYECKVPSLDFASTTFSNLTLDACEIGELTLSAQEPINVHINDCVIDHVIGVTTKQALPSWIRNCEIGTFDALSTLRHIKLAKLNSAQTILVGIIRKTFFQPGTGRKEGALFRGFGSVADHKLVLKIVNKMIADNVLRKFQGNEGPVYAPNRSQTRRMDSILAKLTLSTDPLWIEISKLG